MAKLIALLVVIALGSSFAPRSAAAQTTPAAATTPAPCINGQQRVRLGRVTVGIPCTPGRPTPTWASGTANPVAPRPTVAVAAPATAPVVRPAPAPAGAWGRVFQERERAQLARLQAAPRPYSPPPEYVAAEPSPTPPSTALTDLPDNTVRHFPVWFVGLDAMYRDGGRPHAIICINPFLDNKRVEEMDLATRQSRCRAWDRLLTNSGTDPVDNRADRPEMANGRNADLLIPNTPEWTRAVVTIYGRNGAGEWHYFNQREIVQNDPGASLSAEDIRDWSPRTYLPLSTQVEFPAVRAVASHGHGRPHGHRARRVRHNRSARR